MAVSVLSAGCAQLLDIHERGEGSGTPVGSAACSGDTTDVVDVAPMLAIPGVTAFELSLVALAPGASKPQLGVAWCAQGGLIEFATLELDGTAGTPVTLAGECGDGAIALAATDTMYAATWPWPNESSLSLVDTTGAVVGSVATSWQQASIAGSSDGIVALAMKWPGDVLATQFLAAGTTTFTDPQLLPSTSDCCSNQYFDGAFVGSDYMAVWIDTTGWKGALSRLAAPTFLPGGQQSLPSVVGIPRVTATTQGVMIATSCGGYVFVTAAGDVGPTLAAPDDIMADCGMAATGDEIRLVRPSAGVVSWHALDPSTGAGPELLTIATGGDAHAVASDHKQGYGIVFSVPGGIGYSHVELCSQ